MRQETNRTFDELASGLASGTLSRGKALRLVGAALVGGLLAFTPKVAEAAPPSAIAKGSARRVAAAVTVRAVV